MNLRKKEEEKATKKTGKEQPEDQERLIDVAKRTERSRRDSEHPPGLAI